MAAAGLLIRETLYPPLGEGMLCFFMGGIAYLAYAGLVRTSRIVTTARWLPFVAGAMWLGGLLAVVTEWGAGYSARTWSILYLYPTVLLFPMTILALAVVETRRGPVGKSVALLGDISYSSYLLHFPLQLAFVSIATGLGLSRAIFLSPYVFTGFFCALFLVSLASFRYLESPLQLALRRRLLTQ